MKLNTLYIAKIRREGGKGVEVDGILENLKKSSNSGFEVFPVPVSGDVFCP